MAIIKREDLDKMISVTETLRALLKYQDLPDWRTKWVKEALVNSQYVFDNLEYQYLEDIKLESIKKQLS
jgi:hypothetical protein|tara:strand:- start:888 stop:1094 length:207 start_codon:yes stop_codon:yes gene_type:complete